MRFLVLVSMLVTLVLGSVDAAHAQARAVQATGDDATDFAVLVIKQLGQQQWVIVANLDSGEMTGNVFNLDGSNPQFLRCDIGEPFPSVQEEFVGENVTIDCFAASGCSALPCGGEGTWQPVGERTIPGTFFLP